MCESDRITTCIFFRSTSLILVNFRLLQTVNFTGYCLIRKTLDSTNQSINKYIVNLLRIRKRRSHRYVCPRITHHMLSTRTPFRQVIAPGGTVQSIILLALRATEKQVRSWIKNPVKIEIKVVKQLPGVTCVKFHNSEFGKTGQSKVSKFMLKIR